MRLSRSWRAGPVHPEQLPPSTEAPCVHPLACPAGGLVAGGHVRDTEVSGGAPKIHTCYRPGLDVLIGEQKEGDQWAELTVTQPWAVTRCWCKIKFGPRLASTPGFLLDKKTVVGATPWGVGGNTMFLPGRESRWSGPVGPHAEHIFSLSLSNAERTDRLPSPTGGHAEQCGDAATAGTPARLGSALNQAPEAGVLPVL